MANEVADLSEVKQKILTYQQEVTGKIADLEAKIAAGADLTEIDAAIADLKQTAGNLTLPA